MKKTLKAALFENSQFMFLTNYAGHNIKALINDFKSSYKKDLDKKWFGYIVLDNKDGAIIDKINTSYDDSLKEKNIARLRELNVDLKNVKL